MANLKWPVNFDISFTDDQNKLYRKRYTLNVDHDEAFTKHLLTEMVRCVKESQNLVGTKYEYLLHIKEIPND